MYIPQLRYNAWEMYIYGKYWSGGEFGSDVRICLKRSAYFLFCLALVVYGMSNKLIILVVIPGTSIR